MPDQGWRERNAIPLERNVASGLRWEFDHDAASLTDHPRPARHAVPLMDRADANRPAFVSTGCLPPRGDVRALVSEAHERFRSVTLGQNSQVYPALRRAPSGLFGICVADTAGTAHSAGDAEDEFTIMSISKPFVFALVCQELGVEKVRQKIGVNATGLPFNSVEAIAQSPDGRTNPMVNPGAIATSSLVPGASAEARWQFVRDGLSRFAGRELALNDEVCACALETNHRNQEIARTLASRGRIYSDPVDAVGLYTRQCCLNVTARDLAVMGATLADGGVNPQTGERVIAAPICHYALAVMATAGLYETSGDWLFDIGMPGKSGISGGIVAVSPGKGGIGLFSPPLDATGNSVKGQLAAKFLSHRLGMDLFVSVPAQECGTAGPP